VEVVRVAAEAGVAQFGKLSVDDTKVRASASKRKAMSYGRMREEEARLEEEVAADAGKHPAKAAMAAKLATDAGRAQYAQRKWRAEAPIGWLKEALGFRRFSVRGLVKVRGEWGLVCLALNVKRMNGLQAA